MRCIANLLYPGYLQAATARSDDWRSDPMSEWAGEVSTRPLLSPQQRIASRLRDGKGTTGFDLWSLQYTLGVTVERAHFSSLVWHQPSRLKSLCILPNASVRDSIQAIQDGRMQLALVVGENGRLMGTLTDGDIRRGILRGVALEAQVLEVMNDSYASVSPEATTDEVLQLMEREVVNDVPVVDQMQSLVGLASRRRSSVAKDLECSVLIMAGGEGRRLRPLTDSVPKPLIPIGEKVLLEILIEACVSAGVRIFYISVRYLASQIVDLIGDGSRWGVSIKYLHESQPLGTAGSIGLINDRLEHPLLVINGDVLTRVDLRNLIDFHVKHGALATVCTRMYEVELPFGVVAADGATFLRIEEKPVITHMVNAGMYVLSPQVLSIVDGKTAIDMPEVVSEINSVGKVAVFPIHEYWMDIGTHESLRQVDSSWL